MERLGRITTSLPDLPISRDMTYGAMRRAIVGLPVTVSSAILPNGLWGCYDNETRVILIDRRLTYTAKRCTLVHELLHWKHGDTGCSKQSFEAGATGENADRPHARRSCRACIARTHVRRRPMVDSRRAERDHAGSRGLQADSQGWPVRETPMIHQPSIGWIILVETYCRRARRTSWFLYSLSPVSPSVWPRSFC